MIELRFANRDLYLLCCVKEARVKRYGTQRAGILARRLGQLDTIESLDDLGRLPFDCNRNPDGSLLVPITGRLHFLVRAFFGSRTELVALEVVDIVDKEK